MDEQDESTDGSQDDGMNEDEIAEELVENSDGVEMEEDEKGEDVDYSRLDVTFHLDHVDAQVHEDLVDTGVDVEQEIVNQFSRNVNQFLYGVRDELKYGNPQQ